MYHNLDNCNGVVPLHSCSMFSAGPRVIIKYYIIVMTRLSSVKMGEYVSIQTLVKMFMSFILIIARTHVASSHCSVCCNPIRLLNGHYVTSEKARSQ